MSEPIKLPPLPALVSAMITDYATLAVKQNTAELRAEVERLRAVAGQALEAFTSSNDLLATMYLKMDAVTALRAALKETK